MKHILQNQQSVRLPSIKSLIDSLPNIAVGIQLPKQSFTFNGSNQITMDKNYLLQLSQRNNKTNELSPFYNENAKINSIPTPVPSPQPSPITYMNEKDTQLLSAAATINSIYNNTQTSIMNSSIHTSKKSPKNVSSHMNTPKHSSNSVGKRSNLPKKSVQILNKWLLNHLRNPYPTPQEKKELLELTGLTKIQLSNWFINVRRRKIFSDYYELINKGNGSSGSDSNCSDDDIEVNNKNINLPITRRKKLSDRLEELKKLNEI